MLTLLISLLVIASIGALFYYRISLLLSSIALTVCLLLLSIIYSVGFWLILAWILFVFILLPLNILPLRAKWLTAKILAVYRKMMPNMSSTEREALNAGNVWWEGELFSGKPNWKTLLSYKAASLTEEEQAFLDGPTNQLCHMTNDWQICYEKQDLPETVWNFIKAKKFLGMIIPKQYGGLGFSAYAWGRVVEKLFSCGITLGTTVGVPNSLGPAELLLMYGTDEQKDYYLPRLANAEDIPCFALTSLEAGSDAGAMPDYGVVCQGEFNDETVLGIRLNFDKRYITLAPIATVIGLAFKLYDPEHLIGQQEELGITCALIPHDTPGVETGRRHYPCNNPFQNGPVRGQDVFIPLDYIIGGQRMAGKGWRMLMECLAAGRAICLPASGVAGCKVSAQTAGAYARIRKQFNVPIGKFEGIGEALARIAGRAYWTEAAYQFTLGALNQGEHPAVASGMLKYHLTEANRASINEAMDIHGGRAVCIGPKNYLALSYHGLPIGITVEGANILTRSMIIFGQGAVRCHPFVLKEMQAAEQQGEPALAEFDKALFGHIGFTLSNLVRSVWLGLSGSRFVRMTGVPKSVRCYYQHLTRFSAAFALCADFAMLSLASDLKRKEKLSARFSDVLSQLYILSAVLKRYADEDYPQEDLPLVQWCCKQGLYTIQQQLDGLLQNLPNYILATCLKRLIFPWGKYFNPPSDHLGQTLSNLLLNDSATRQRLIRGVYRTEDIDHPTGIIEATFKQVLNLETIEQKVEIAFKQGEIKGHDFADRVHAAVEQSIVTGEQANALLALDSLRKSALAVDEFDSHLNQVL